MFQCTNNISHTLIISFLKPPQQQYYVQGAPISTQTIITGTYNYEFVHLSMVVTLIWTQLVFYISMCRDFIKFSINPRDIYHFGELYWRRFEGMQPLLRAGLRCQTSPGSLLTQTQCVVSLTFVLRALQNILSKFVYCRILTSYANSSWKFVRVPKG